MTPRFHVSSQYSLRIADAIRGSIGHGRSQGLSTSIRHSYHACWRSTTTQSLGRSRDDDRTNFAFRFREHRRRSNVKFRGSIPSRCMNPVRTLTRHPYGDNVIVKGRCDSLSVHRTGLDCHDLSQHGTCPSQFVAIVAHSQWEPEGQVRAVQTRYMSSLMSTLLPIFYFLHIRISIIINPPPPMRSRII